MTKIKWTDKTKEVVGAGLLVEGQTHDVADDIAKALIKQGQAQAVKAAAKPKAETNTKESEV